MHTRRCACRGVGAFGCVPVIAYVGQTRSRTLIARLAALGLGELVVRWELPARRQPFAFDNGCYRDWRAGAPFNVTRWTATGDRFPAQVRDRSTPGVATSLQGIHFHPDQRD